MNVHSVKKLLMLLINGIVHFLDIIEGNGRAVHNILGITKAFCKTFCQ